MREAAGAEVIIIIILICILIPLVIMLNFYIVIIIILTIIVILTIQTSPLKSIFRTWQYLHAGTPSMLLASASLVFAPSVTRVEILESFLVILPLTTTGRPEIISTGRPENLDIKTS